MIVKSDHWKESHRLQLNIRYIMQGVLKLKHNAMVNDTRPIDPKCACMVCF